ncbi:MerR family transcriptional regulator [Kribbella solani]|uniref:DNA-binding transcriptional MerR regulator n=1 Tax=Kribbella solani TaxID=236067 RepID=A0A841DJH6_9ACTN|nr:MerR family transcriptional regulator [Kribbella solani]MBB5978743.1 DNA-binding transcriptional MerR regulator [Kribbella solani]
MDHSIGAVARLAGVSVKAVRHYSDLGLLPYTRTPAGHRRYDDAAVARLRLIRTLRALDVDLPTIRAVLHDERSLAEVAATHAEALAIQIRTLQRQHALLKVLANHPEDRELMDELTDQTEQRALVADFLRTTLGDTDPAVQQNLTPVLPDDPTPEQFEAWMELTALMADEDFRASVRRIVVGYHALAGDDPLRADPELRGRLIELWRAEGGSRWLRYVELVAVVNGWVAPSRVAG